MGYKWNPNIKYNETEFTVENDIVFFFREYEANGMFSNFAPLEVLDCSLLFPTGEHYYHAEKAKFFGDQEAYEKILAAKTPMQAKRLGRQVKGFDPKVWDEHKYPIMLKVLRGKCNADTGFYEALLNTHGCIYAECNPYDRILGIGKKTFDQSKWGQNLLGKALKEISDEVYEFEYGYHNQW